MALGGDGLHSGSGGHWAETEDEAGSNREAVRGVVPESDTYEMCGHCVNMSMGGDVMGDEVMFHYM